MKPIMRSLSPQTKLALVTQFDDAVRKARAQGDGAGWRRGFRVGALLGVATVSLVVLVIGGVAWVAG